MQPLDTLIPPATTIVVLDTSPARNLAYSTERPTWVATFAEMARSEDYSFSLADNAFAELLNQIASGALARVESERIFESLQLFLNPNLPILPGKRDILSLIGGHDHLPDWSPDEVAAISRRAWDHLRNASSSGTAQSTDEELQDERAAWFNIFETLGNFENSAEELLNEYTHSQLNLALVGSNHQSPELVPPLSVRWDLQVRFFWRQYVRSKKELEPYDPTSRKKRNDGIDFGVFQYLMLPALVVATDKGFFDKIADIKSYQKPWFWKPEELATAWTSGERPRPTWP